MGLYQFIRPYLFKGDPEKIHEAAHSLLKVSQALPFACSITNYFFSYPSSLLEQDLWGIKFDNPFGLAGGFDKNADVLKGMASLGFGFLEVGSVTNKPSMGNDKPRLFRLEDDCALINRMGLNNVGAERFLENFHKANCPVPVFINITKTNDPTLYGDLAVDDIRQCYEVVGGSAKVLVLNLSCPNTKDGKTFEDLDSLKKLLEVVFSSKERLGFKHRTLVKLSNDIALDKLPGVLEICANYKLDGYVVSNTSVSREGLKTSAGKIEEIGRGGLSGKPIFERSLERVKEVFSLTKGEVPIVAVGGVGSVQDAIRMLEGGASLIEVYTALIYEGPGLIKSLCEGVEAEMIRRGYLSLSEFRKSE